MWHDAVEATHGFISPEDRRAIAETVRDVYLPAADLLIAVDRDDRPLGWLGRAAGELEALFVDPAAHCRGIGRALVDAAFDRDAPVTVEVNEGNAVAIAFYRRLGVVEVGRSPLDGQGRAYPLIHLSRAGADAPISAP